MAVDRTVLPKVSEISGLKLPDIQSFALSNGVKLYTITQSGIDICKISIIWNVGKYDVDNAWALSVMSSLILNGTDQHSSDEITDFFDFYGSKVSCGSDAHTTKFTITALNRTLPELLPMVLEVLRQSVFPQKEIDSKIRKFYANETIKRNTVQFQSLSLCKTLIFPESHPAVLCEKDINGLKNVSRDEIMALYDKVIINQRPTIFIAGNVTTKVSKLVETLFGDKHFPCEPITRNVIPFSIEKKFEIKKLSMPDQVQSSLDIMIPTISCHSGDIHNLKFSLVVLGGYFGSRLNKVIRETKGLTYGINAMYKNSLEGGLISINSQCAGKNVDEVIKEIKRQMDIMRSELISDKELSAVRRFYLYAMSATSENLFNALDYYISCYINGVPFEQFNIREQAIHLVSPKTVMDIAQKYFDADKMQIGVAGDV